MPSEPRTLKLAGHTFVVLPMKQYRQLLAGAAPESPAEADLPCLPPADAEGNRPALEYVRTSIARDIVRERRELGLTQQKLAQLAGVRQETLSRLESGKHSPTVRTVEKIEKALGRSRAKVSAGKPIA
ncbi:MAG TPA: helix-turn-helix transcriptional regulator [Pirellulales bacterium]|nr:helix-turn-helix transcriptional regulator [Pirellulales bacterium]